MSDSYLVRASRDGDQFHYSWAARRCLRLLLPQAQLVAVTIEGASPVEGSDNSTVSEGEELIDVAEYYGSEQIESASLIRYMQLKHSTLHRDKPWTASGLQKTLEGFAGRHKELVEKYVGVDFGKKLEFWFVTNRPVSIEFREAIEDAGSNAAPRHLSELSKLETFVGETGEKLAQFCRLVRFDDKQDDYWEQRNLLAQDVRGYLPDSDVDAPTQLRELVTRKATSEYASNPTIRKFDVLRVFRTDPDELFPAPCRIAELTDVVPREQEPELIQRIIQAGNTPVIVHADGGVGKSVFATRIKFGLPVGSTTVLYDCFGSGQYRSVTGYRHRHKDALVQIANELAGQGLCHPLIPTPNAEPSAFMKAFLHRLNQSIVSLRAKSSEALLCIVVDAADNAQIAAEEIGETRSFARDLLRVNLPEGVRLVVSCRTHRKHYLDPPPNVVSLELKPFSRCETSAYLRQKFPEASEPDIDEFHRLSSQNPRVQWLALLKDLPLGETLRLLGPNPTTVDEAIGALLNDSIAKVRDAIGPIERERIDRICAGLAALRPLIPISVLSAMSNVDEAAVRSFAFDLGRPLIVTDSTIQFYDEPAETWFREHFRPSATELSKFIDSLKPLTATSSYVASALPQLMLEAGQFTDLVALALSVEGLPEASPLERRDIELQRLQFALKASLRSKCYLAAAKLALKSGGESAGEVRQRKLLQENTDLAATFMDGDRIQEIVSRRTFGSGWLGSHHAYEAAFMSGKPELIGEARSRLRMAMEWLGNWAALPDEERKDEHISDGDIADIALAHLNIHGAKRCARSLRGWTPRNVTFRVGRLVVQRLIDHGRFKELDDLAIAAGNDFWLILAITLELRAVRREPPKPVVARALRLLSDRRVELEDKSHYDSSEEVLQSVAALIEAGYRHSICNGTDAANILTRYLPSSPPRGLSTRWGGSRVAFLRAYALRAQILGQPLKLIDLAHAELKKELERENRYSHSRDVQEFEEDVGALLPWHQLWATVLVAGIPRADLAAKLDETKSHSSKAANIHYREESNTSDEIALIWFDILALSDAVEPAFVQAFNAWMGSLRRPLCTPTLNRLARLTAQYPSAHKDGLDYAQKSFSLTRSERADAEEKSSGYVSVARSVLMISRAESQAYFDQAIEVSNKIGDENRDRWAALLDLADRAARTDRRCPEVAYDLSRCAEVTYQYFARDKYFDWNGTIAALVGLCPSSSLAIFSRWRDRGFGDQARVLPTAMEALRKRREIDPRDVLALVPLRCDWEQDQLLADALDKLTDTKDKAAAAEFVYRYMSLHYRATERWGKLKAVASGHGIPLPGLEDLIRYAELEDRDSKAKSAEREPSFRAKRHDENPDWNAVFKDLDLTDPNGITLANKRFRSAKPPYISGDFFDQALKHLPAGGEADFIRAVADVADFGLYNLRSLLEKIPRDWRDRPAIKAAVGSTLKRFCRSYCMEITKSRYYETLPLKLACELSGVSEAEVVDEVLMAVGESTELVGASRLFTLVGLLSPKLKQDEALEALSFGLELFAPVLDDDDGDGPWAPSLAPPANVQTCLAGYIWGCLAAPESALRWEAAHVVAALCRLGRRDVLRHLIGLAKADAGGPFADARLYFYNLHGRQWLMIALARAAQETPECLVEHFSFVVDEALHQAPHVLLRRFAARAALAMIKSNVVASDKKLTNQLQSVNVSPHPAKTSKDHASPRSGGKKDEIPEEHRYFFGFDIGPYWLAPLGRRFGLYEQDMEIRAADIIRNEWKFAGGSRWDEDERAKLGLYEERSNYHSHGSYPRSDDLRFYLSYHAMFVLAGKLLATVPVRRDSYDPEDPFEDWLKYHDVTRKDGYWLADRRDTAPLDLPTWVEEKDHEHWRWSVARNDFDRILFPQKDRLNLWGWWTTTEGRREEKVYVASALVVPDRSEALLRALQSTKNPHDYRIPDAFDELQINRGPFQLKGWVDNRDMERGLDRHDPWAGSINYPAPAPAPYVVDLMQLGSDREKRIWQTAKSLPLLWSSVWGRFEEKDNDSAANKGDRLQATTGFMVEFLDRIGMDLVIKIEIDRRHHNSRYDSRDENEDNGFDFFLPSARLFLFKRDGNVISF